ncbi:ATP-binding protein [Actinosynnema sp. NPDC023587]|uniref:ATP-binding protein n=1 Tax=Actinosynnema sp. NPDC023587 TaxID=3154695 RepID=UPI0033ECD369
MTTGQGSAGGDDGGSADVTRDLATTSNREIRRLVADLLHDHGGVVTEDAVLVVDELVGNARRHGTPPLRCRLSVLPRRFRVEVDDTDQHRPRIRSADDTGGRGMVLVERLTAEWGVLHRRTHKTVWAELELDRPTSPLLTVVHGAGR